MFFPIDMAKSGLEQVRYPLLLGLKEFLYAGKISTGIYIFRINLLHNIACARELSFRLYLSL